MVLIRPVVGSLAWSFVGSLCRSLAAWRRGAARATALGVAALAVVALGAGCKQSLFDEHGGSTDGGGGSGASACPSPCVADAAADFDGSARGVNGRWRYLDDHRDRTWTAMTAAGGAMTGADPANKITTCKAKPGAAACSGLPGALLVSAAGGTSAADPAIELTASSAQVLQLQLHALVPSGPDQVIRVYRNSREDVLYTGVANAGAALERSITLDALAGDRFLVALAPTGAGASEVGLQLYASATGASFPSSCQLALAFESVSGNTVASACGGTFTHSLFDAGMDTPPQLTAGPYPELGKGTDLVADAYFTGTGTLDKSNDVTVQFWVKHRSFFMSYDAWLFSDLDLDVGAKGGGGGLGIVIFQNGGSPQLEVTTCTSANNPLSFDSVLVPYPSDESWQLVRVSQAGDAVSVCLNGKKVGSLAVKRGLLKSSYPPYLGKNVRWTPAGAFVDAVMDDVRVMSGALPCE